MIFILILLFKSLFFKSSPLKKKTPKNKTKNYDKI